MIRNARRARWPVLAMLVGVVVSLPACQLSPEQQGWADTLQTFIEEFARQVVQAVVL